MDLVNEPSPIIVLRENLQERNRGLLSRRDELLAAADRVPQIINDEELAKRAADFTKQLAACFKDAESRRVHDKEPYLAAGRAVDAWYKQTTDAVDAAKREIERRLTTYQRAKAEAERRIREEAERKARAAAEAAAAAAIAAEQKMRDARDLDAAIAAAAAAKQAAADAELAAKEAAAKPAELSRTRAEYGAVASLRTFWDFADLDRERIDLEALRSHLPMEALEKAVRAFVKAGGRELRGVRIFENTQTQVR